MTNGVSRPYEMAHVAVDGARHKILLDGRPAKTRGGNALSAPTAALADAIASEWNAQGPKIDRASMPLTRLVMTAIDLGPADRDAWRDAVLNFMKSDLLCYRATEPASLVAAQAAIWDPLLQWAKDDIGAALATTSGVGFVAQSHEAIAVAARALEPASNEELIAIRTAAEISGSAIIAFALWREFQSADALFEAARLDEAFQEKRWGVDSEAAARTQRIRQDFNDAALLLRLLR